MFEELSMFSWSLRTKSLAEASVILSDCSRTISVPLASVLWNCSEIMFWACRDSYPSPVPKSLLYWTALLTCNMAGTANSKATIQNATMIL